MRNQVQTKAKTIIPNRFGDTTYNYILFYNNIYLEKKKKKRKKRRRARYVISLMTWQLKGATGSSALTRNVMMWQLKGTGGSSALTKNLLTWWLKGTGSFSALPRNVMTWQLCTRTQKILLLKQFTDIAIRGGYLGFFNISPNWEKYISLKFI